MSCVITSADTESSVTMTASFLVVPASRRECASTKAPARGSDKLGFLGVTGISSRVPGRYVSLSSSYSDPIVSFVVLCCPLLSRCRADSPTPRGSVECLQIQWRLESQQPGAGRTSDSSRSTYRDVGVLAVLRSHCVWLRGCTGAKWEGKNAERAMLCRYATDYSTKASRGGDW